MRSIKSVHVAQSVTHLIAVRGREFAAIVMEQKMRLSERWTDVEINAIELEFQSLKLAYEGEDPLKASLDACQ